MASIAAKPQIAPQPSGSLFTTDTAARTILLSLLLAAATVLIYLPVHNHPFFNLDDPRYVTENLHIRHGPTAAMLFWACTHGYSSNWHPLTWWSHALDIQLFGLDPAGHHDENVVLHALNAVLLFCILKRATGYTWRSFLVAALFALHPLNVESVAWVAERKTMLSTLFALCTLGAYRWYAHRPGGLRYLTVTVLFILGLMSKPQIIMHPLVLLLWDYWPLQRMFAEGCPRIAASQTIPAENLSWLVKEKLPLFLICILDAAVTLIAQHIAGGMQPYSLWIRIENALVSYVRYIGKAFWPANLALYYPHPGWTLPWWQASAAFFLLLTITVLASRARRHRYLIVGWLWFLIMLLPMIGLVQADVQGMADRYAYVSFIGLFLMICWSVADWSAQQHLPRAFLPAVSVAVLLALSLITHRQLRYWHDNVSLWAHSTQVTSRNWKAEYFLGMALEADGKPEQALQHYLRAAEINPTDPFVNLGVALYAHKHGRLTMAVEYYNRVLPQAWNSEQKAVVLANLASVYRVLGDTAKANECMSRTNALPQSTVDWQGSWWKQIIPTIEHYFRGGSGKSTG